MKPKLDLRSINARLKVGQNIEAALTEAQAKLADADAMQKQAVKTLDEAKAKAKAHIAEANEIVANANAQQAEATKRLSEVEARERAVAEAIAKAERAKGDADRLRSDLQRRTDYLRGRLQEIAA